MRLKFAQPNTYTYASTIIVIVQHTTGPELNNFLILRFQSYAKFCKYRCRVVTPHRSTYCNSSRAHCNQISCHTPERSKSLLICGYALTLTSSSREYVLYMYVLSLQKTSYYWCVYCALVSIALI